MDLQSYFSDFLRQIRLTDDQVDDCKTGHVTLRDRLAADKKLSPITVSTFLQGSYRRSTAVRPQGETRADVDVVVVTRLSCDEYPNPAAVFGLFIPFLKEYYPGKYRIQGRSIGIGLSYVDLDLVITSAPSEAEIGLLQSESVTTAVDLLEAQDWKLAKSWVPREQRAGLNQKALREAAREPEWKTQPLYIPDRDAKCWRPTHPLAQLQWTRDKNGRCNGHYVNVVKALKWWRLQNPELPEHPKGYPLEHLVGSCCPDGIESVAQGVTLALETIVSRYANLVSVGGKPQLADHGVPGHDVFGRITPKEFAQFYEQVKPAASLAREALDATAVSASAEAWHALFGNRFPECPESTKAGPAASGYTPRSEPTQIGRGRFA